MNERQHGFWRAHQTDASTWPRPDYVTRAMPADEWGEDLIATCDRKPCLADPRYFHHISNGLVYREGRYGRPEGEPKLECSCQLPCSSDWASYLAMQGSSIGYGPAIFLCEAHLTWFEENRLLGGGAGGNIAAVGPDGVWRRTDQNHTPSSPEWR